MKNLFAGLLGPKKDYTYYMQQGAKAFEAEKYQDAEREYSRALEMAEDDKAHREVALASVALAKINERLEKLAVAETHYRKGYTTHEESEEFEEAARALTDLGRLYYKQRRYPDAEQVLQYALAIYQQQCGAGHEGIAESANVLGDCLMGRNAWAEAENIMLRAIAIDEATKGTSHSIYAEDLHKLAVCLDQQNKDAEASVKFKSATETFDKNRDSFTRDTAHRATACYHDYGKHLKKLNKLPEAKAAFTRGMELAEAYPGYLNEGDLAQHLS